MRALQRGYMRGYSISHGKGRLGRQDEERGDRFDRAAMFKTGNVRAEYGYCICVQLLGLTGDKPPFRRLIELLSPLTPHFRLWSVSVASFPPLRLVAPCVSVINHKLDLSEFKSEVLVRAPLQPDLLNWSLGASHREVHQGNATVAAYENVIVLDRSVQDTDCMQLAVCVHHTLLERIGHGGRRFDPEGLMRRLHEELDRVLSVVEVDHVGHHKTLEGTKVAIRGQQLKLEYRAVNKGRLKGPS